MPKSVAGSVHSAGSAFSAGTAKVLSSDSEPLMAYAGRFPQPAKAKGEDSRVGVMYRNASVRVVDFLQKNPHAGNDVWAFCESLQTKAPADVVVEHFSAQYKKIWHIPTEWWVQWLGNYCGDALPLAVVAKMRSQDERSVKVVAYYLTGLSGSCELPAELLQKQVSARVFQQLALSLDRFDIVARAVNARTGALDYTKLAVYKMVWDDDETSEKIEHLPIGEVVELSKGNRFGKNFKIEELANDRDAMAVGPYHAKGQGLSLHALFGRETGPWTHMVPTVKDKLEGMGVDVEAQIANELSQARAGTFSDQDAAPVDERVTEKRKEALAKARAAVKAKKARVSVDAAGPSE